MVLLHTSEKWAEKKLDFFLLELVYILTDLQVFWDSSPINHQLYWYIKAGDISNFPSEFLLNPHRMLLKPGGFLIVINKTSSSLHKYYRKKTI